MTNWAIFKKNPRKAGSSNLLEAFKHHELIALVILVHESARVIYLDKLKDKSSSVCKQHGGNELLITCSSSLDGTRTSEVKLGSFIFLEGVFLLSVQRSS